MSKLQEVLEARTARSALVLRELLGPVRLEPVSVDVGRPYYRAVTSIDALALIDAPRGALGGRFAFFAVVDWPYGFRTECLFVLSRVCPAKSPGARDVPWG